MNIELDYEALASIMDKCGIPTGELRSSNRAYPLAYYRGMLVEQLRERGYTMTSIGCLFGRSHATMIHDLRLLGNLDAPHHRAIRQEYELFKRICGQSLRRPIGIIIHGQVYEYIERGFCDGCELKRRCDCIQGNSGHVTCPALFFDVAARGQFKRNMVIEKRLYKDE